ncbi:restriction endonuclease subunit S, partial [Exercitatus varius]
IHQRKLENVKKLKAGLLQKMFPKNDQEFPEIRFPEFTYAWEQRTLKEVAKYRNGKAHEKDVVEKGQYIIVNSKFISSDGAIRKYTNKLIEPLYTDEIAFVLSDVPNGKALAKTYLIDSNNKYSLNQRIAGITPNKDTYPYFLNILMNRNDYFLKFDNGVGQTNLSKTEVEDFILYCPMQEEQQKIGTFFTALDRYITIHQRKLENMQKLKKSLLQQMFV